jgi:hypothetical protein
MNTPQDKGFRIGPAEQEEAEAIARKGQEQAAGVHRAASDEGQHPNVVDSTDWTGDSDHALPNTPEDANRHPEKKI